MARQVDEDFRGLPLQALADAALQRAGELGAEHADLRVERVRGADVRVRDGQAAGGGDATQSGLAVRVVVDGTWGFASAADLTPEAAVRAADDAVQMARVSRPLSTERVEPGRRAGARRRVGLLVRGRPVRRPAVAAGRACCRRGRASCCRPGSRTSTPSGVRSRSRSSTPTSPAPAPPSSACACSPC
ncbi:hypothetical protein GCM10025868_02060 [Angustibacter aerolatus]|uniref:Metalloprotease TldD/E N-terminal domain-containing protein n=1 Tax=Angustibacter aerolatus TaxID=1162965 RepID=A0ABQ6J9U4_9ACTN|nr:DNA gyrase modulator [Angustibacter aerolatus]GMA84956.1 hypothetical protein GCM10025868_02060 [Angustibacter aerolatus]